MFDQPGEQAMRTNGNGDGDAEIDRLAEVVVQAANVVDVSMAAVNARLRVFVAEHREKQARGERGRFFESVALLCAMCEQALEAQEAADRKLAEAEAKLERLELEQSGGRLQ
jgi:hypothetical protein